MLKFVSLFFHSYISLIFSELCHLKNISLPEIKKSHVKHHETLFFCNETLCFHYFYISLWQFYGIRCMKKHVFLLIFASTVIFLASCAKDDSLRKMEQIKAIGDKNPIAALKMLDSLEVEVRDKNVYIRNKYDLLRIRLNDKAYIMPSSDIMIKKLVTYFEEKGTTAERQEVHHYAGSIYRDLQDAPRALEHFFKSIEYAEKNEVGCDSDLLCNSYSNINYLQYKVQNYNEARKAAVKELELCKKMKIDPTIPFTHLGTSCQALERKKEAEAYYDSAYSRIIQSETISEQQELLAILANNYSELKQLAKARNSLELIEEDPLEGTPGYSCVAFAEYYKSLGKIDSAAIYSKRIIEEGTDIYGKYDAAKLLFSMYSQVGDGENARRYAEVYMQLSDSLDFGKRQELAATVNNIYQYHLDQKKERELKEKSEHYKSITIISFLAASLFVCMAYILNFKRKQKHQKEVAALSSALQRVSNDGEQLRKEIKKKEDELVVSRESLKEKSNELDDVKQKYQTAHQELLEYDEALKKTEKQLEERKEQNKTFIKLLHQSEFEASAEDVIKAVREASKGKKEMTMAEWKQLYQAVDELYPTFHETILKQPERLSEKEMQVMYLLRIGLSKRQIMNMTDMARVTIWRWEKKFEWVLDEG